MDVITLDYESFWDTDYSLSKMSPLEYVMGERFELQSMSIKLNNYPTDVFFGEAEIRRVTSKIDWSNKAVLAHNNAGFDSYISAYRLDINPKLWMCTLAMARPIHAKTCGLGLGKLVEHYNLGKKDNTVLMQTKGRRLADFTADEMERMREYNKEDTELCWRLFKKLKPHYKAAELWQIDALVRMRTEPAFVLNVPMLETAASVVRSRKHAALLDLAKLLKLDGVQWGDDLAVAEQVRGELASAPKFAALLTSQGVATPMKASPTSPDKQIPALSKTDQAFLDLQDHPNEVVAMAALTRLDVKSTLLETRIAKFLTAAKYANGKLPVPLQYCGADTTGRDSGCLVADTMVLVYDCLTDSQANKRIVDVLSSDLVWDGEEFVTHGGVAFSGYAEVITWDGITGTEDHVVFTNVGEISLSAARARSVPIQIAACPTQHHLDAARKHADNDKK